MINFKCEKYKEIIELLQEDYEEDLTSYYGKIIEILKGYSFKNINDNESAENQFRKLYKIFKIQSLSNPYDVNTLILRSLILLELKEVENCENLLSGIERTDDKKYINIISEIRKLIIIKQNEENKLEEKSIIINILGE